VKEGVVYGNADDQLELEAPKIEQQKGELKATKESINSSLSILTGKIFRTASSSTYLSRY
jgi:hypothetical protein